MILVKFKNLSDMQLFSFSLLDTFKEDPQVEKIINNLTGVIIFER